MKKILSLILVFTIILSMAACGNTNENATQNTANNTEAHEPSTNPTTDINTQPSKPDDGENQDNNDNDNNNTDWENLGNVDITKLNEFKAADITAAELNKMLRDKLDVENRNFAMHTQVDVKSAFTNKETGDKTETTVTASSDYAERNFVVHGNTSINIKTAQAINNQDDLETAVEFYINRETSDLYSNETTNGQNSGWKHADNAMFFAQMYMITIGCEGLAEDIVIKDDEIGHYVFSVNVAERLTGALSTLGRLKKDTQVIYVVEKDTSAVRVYINDGKFDETQYGSQCTDISSSINAFMAIYNIGKVKYDRVAIPEDVMSLKEKQSSVLIHDNANLLSDNEEKELFDIFFNRCDGLGYNVLFLTIDNTNGQSTKTYTDNYMDQLFSDYNHNISFIIDMDNREIYINTMGNAIKSLDDKDIENALDVGFAYVCECKYTECLAAMADYCINKLNAI